ncbi:MAG: T9SS C-terminal target domain-containing protein, partial [Bacteroidetes bacterium]
EEEEPTTVVDIILESEIHTTLAAAVAAAGLVETLQGDGPFTVFAPTDDAFAALPEGLLDDLLDDPEGLLTDILLYHVVGAFALSTDLEDGQEITTLLGQDVVVTITNGSVFINDAEVILADLVADNGVVHVIDAVLVPEEEEEPTTVVDIILESEIHTTLAAAVAAAGLVETLQGDGPFTVFAPTDDAFAALPEGLLDDLLDDPEGLLTDILLYHVVGAFALSTDLEDGQEITTLLGQDVVVTITNGSVFINDAEVILADLVADNGVVHVIDAVLVPEEEPEVVTCAFSQGYWFARPQTVWPYDVEVGGLTFTQEEGAAFWPPNTNTRRAFTQYSAIYLSGVTISLFPELEDAMETIDNYFANYYPAPAGIQINRAAGFIGKWINSNHCEDYEYNYNNQNIFSLSTESPVIVYPNPFRTRVSMQFSIEESSRVKLEVYNLVGERIAVLFDSYVNEYDIHSVSMDADNLPNGIYFYRFSTDKEVFMDKLILAR